MLGSSLAFPLSTILLAEAIDGLSTVLLGPWPIELGLLSSSP